MTQEEKQNALKEQRQILDTLASLWACYPKLNLGDLFQVHVGKSLIGGVSNSTLQKLLDQAEYLTQYNRSPENPDFGPPYKGS